MNIPIYRAKKIDNDEYVEGYIMPDTEYDLKETKNDEWVKTNMCHVVSMWVHKDRKWVNIDLSTIAIHFPNMLDKNNKKIFASLSKDGIGGNECINPKWEGKNNPYNLMVARLIDTVFGLMFLCDKDLSLLNYKDVEVIGIHKG